MNESLQSWAVPSACRGRLGLSETSLAPRSEQWLDTLPIRQRGLVRKGESVFPASMSPWM